MSQPESWKIAPSAPQPGTSISRDDSLVLYGAINPQVLAMVPPTVGRLLDLGCGTGVFGQAIKARQATEIVGVTYNPEEAEIARSTLDDVIVADLNTYDPSSLGRFDMVICSHVLEHLNQPGEVLTRLRPCLEGGGELVVALPNILFWRQRLVFLGGTFRYTETGLMDRTHVRFFDWRTAHELIRGGGYAILESRADGYLPGSWVIPPLKKRLDELATRWWPGVFGAQFRFRCTLASEAG